MWLSDKKKNYNLFIFLFYFSILFIILPSRTSKPMAIIASPTISANVIICTKRMALSKIEDSGMMIVQMRRLPAPVLSRILK